MNTLAYPGFSKGFTLKGDCPHVQFAKKMRGTD